VRLEDPRVGVGLAGEQDAAAADVVVLALVGGGVPQVAGEVAVGGGQEFVAVRLVLADEQHPGRFAVVDERAGPPFLQSPGAERRTAKRRGGGPFALKTNP
jgi:hypothetical protein